MSARPTVPSPTRLPENVQRVLTRLARKDLRARMARFPALVAICLPLIWLFEALMDLVFNLSWGARVGFLAVCAVVVAWLFFRHVIIPVRRRLNLRAAALLVERKFPQFRSSLISAVDFTATGNGPAPRSAPLIQILLGEVGRRVDRTEIVRGIVDTRTLRRLQLTALAVLAAGAGLVWYFQPQSMVLVRRILLARDALPSRTSVECLTGDFTLNTGSNVELAARAKGAVPKNGRLVVAYADGHTDAIAVSESAVEAGVFRVTLRNILQSFRYHFEINDGASAEFQVKTRTLPSLATTKFIYLPPSYTGRPETEAPAGSLSLLAGSRLVIEGEATQPLKSATLELKGLEQTQRMDNGNAAENLRFRITANEPRAKELQEQADKLRPDVDSTAAEEETTRKTLEEAKKILDATPEGDERRKRGAEFEKAANAHREVQTYAERARSSFNKAKRELEEVEQQTANLKKQLEQAEAAPPPDKEAAAKQKRRARTEIIIPKEGLNGLSIHLVNEDGLASENDPIYRVTITADKPPVAEIAQPKAERKTVLANDKVLVKFRARDDYRLEKVALRYVVLRPNADGEVAPAEEGTIPISFPEGAATMTKDHLWDLASFLPPLTEGCSVSYWVEARDHQTLYNNNPGMSRKMLLAVVSPEEKKKELLEEMEKAAKEIERLSERQRKNNEKTDANLRR